MHHSRHHILTLALAILLGIISPVGADDGKLLDITVIQGDTLSHLCAQHLEDPRRCDEVARVNRMRNADRIYAGQRLRFPVALLRGVPEESLVTFVKGESWQVTGEGREKRTIAINDRLKEGSLIQTGPEGMLELTFEDGTICSLRPSSQMQIVRARRKGDNASSRELFLKAGRVINRIRKATGREQRFEIRTPSAIAAARGTEFRVAVDSDDLTRSEVLEGEIGVAAVRRQVLVAAGQGTLIKKGEAPAPPRQLLPPPELARAPEMIRTLPFPLRLTPASCAVSYRATIARDSAMKDLILDQVQKSGEPFTLAGLADGRHYLQLLSIDQHGLEGAPTPPIPINIRTNPVPPFIQEPVDKSEVRDRRAGFRWLKVRDAVGYHLQVGDCSFTSLLTDATGIGSENHELTDLPFGTHCFRLSSIAADGYEGVWSAPLSFTVTPPPPTPRMEHPLADENTVRIRVQELGQGVTYRFQVATDESFSQPLLDRKEECPTLTLPMPKEPGIYFVRSQGIDKTGREGSYSQAQSFVVEQKFPYSLMGVLSVIGLILGLAL